MLGQGGFRSDEEKQQDETAVFHSSEAKCHSNGELSSTPPSHPPITRSVIRRCPESWQDEAESVGLVSVILNWECRFSIASRAKRYGPQDANTRRQIAFAPKTPANRFAAIIRISQPHAMEQPVGALGAVNQRLPAERVFWHV